MTRINCCPVSDLADQHLLAEYRELPRVFALASAWVERGCPGPIPATYRMGSGHVRFFYPRTAYLAARQRELIAECLERGFAIQHTTGPEPVAGADADWSPTAADVAVNLERLRSKVAARPTFYRYGGHPVGPDFYGAAERSAA